jgi:hypothetical protein
MVVSNTVLGMEYVAIGEERGFGKQQNPSECTLQRPMFRYGLRMIEWSQVGSKGLDARFRVIWWWA